MTESTGRPIVDKRDVEVLRSICGDDGVLSDSADMTDYTHDELKMVRGEPDAVVFPRTAGEVRRVLEYAASRGIPVTPRGAGTGLCGGAVPIHGGIVLSTAKMNSILEIDKQNMTVTVESGVLLMNLHETVGKEGLFYAPDPGEKTATIGGNISTNAGGMRAMKYGVTRDNVMGLDVVLPSGDSMTIGGKQAKASTGYSLLDLFVGSEGTLGIVTRAVLKLLPQPPRLTSLLIPFQSLSDAIGAVPPIVSTGFLPQSIEFAERGIIEAAETYLGRSLPHQGAAAYLFVRLEGGSDIELDEVTGVVAEVALKCGASDVLLANTNERQQALWDARAAFLAAVKSTGEVDECDVVVPRTRIPAMIDYSKQVADEVGIRIESFGHAGDGNLHIYVIRDQLEEEVWQDKLTRAMDLLYEKGHELGGLISGEHGIGAAKRSYMAKHLSAQEVEIMRAIKASLDPKGLLNPGKVV